MSSVLVAYVTNFPRDSPELPLSPLQRENFNGWKRPSRDLVSNPVSTTENEAASAPTMVAKNPVDLVQDVTTDCSVVASLCAAISREERGYFKVHRPSISGYGRALV